MSKSNPQNPVKFPPVIHYGSAYPGAPSPNRGGGDSTMLLADVSTQYGSSIPATKFAKIDSASNGEKEMPVTVDTSTAKHGSLPLFLTKTYHMLDSSDNDIASWTENGDAFIITDTDKFAAEILPKYFKHSNYSSFARQLNFYGFRKLKNDPILTADFDLQKINSVSFFHDKFQRGKPDLMKEIKRATKTDQTTKPEAESLKEQISSLRFQLENATEFYNRRLDEIVRDYDSKFYNLWTQLQPLLPNGSNAPMPTQLNQANTMPNLSAPPFIHNPNMSAAPQGVYLTQPHSMQPQPVMHQPQPAHRPVSIQTKQAAAPIAHQPLAAQTVHTQPFDNTPTPNSGYTMQSLSHVAGVKLQSPSVQPQLPPAQPAAMNLADQGVKRAAEPAPYDNAKKSRTDGGGEE